MVGMYLHCLSNKCLWDDMTFIELMHYNKTIITHAYFLQWWCDGGCYPQEGIIPNDVTVMPGAPFTNTDLLETLHG